MSTLRKLGSLAVAAFLLSGCRLRTETIGQTFDLPSVVGDKIEAVALDAAFNKTKLSTLCCRIREEFGEIYSLERYTTSSSFSEGQEDFSKLVSASGLRQDETFVAMSLDGDQVCYVICDKADIVVRSAMNRHSRPLRSDSSEQSRGW